MERSTVYILVKKADLDNVKNTDMTKYDSIIGNKVKEGWASVENYSAVIRDKDEVLVTLITIDDVKWCRGFNDVSVIYDFFKTLDYWELLQITETGEITYEEDDETADNGYRVLTANTDVDMSGLTPVKEDNSADTLTEEEIPELIGQIVDLCENFLDEKKIVLKINADRDEALTQGADLEETAQIYGEYYDRFSVALRPTLEKLIELNIRLTKEEADRFKDKVICCFWNILTDSQAYIDRESGRCELKDKDFTLREIWDRVTEIIDNWEIVDENQTGKYLLISMCEREMMTHSFESLEKAQKMMKFEFEEICKEQDIEGADCSYTV